MTEAQKEEIYAALAGDEFARWAREVLLSCARELRGERGEENDGGGWRMEDGEPGTWPRERRMLPIL